MSAVSDIGRSPAGIRALDLLSASPPKASTRINAEDIGQKVAYTTWARQQVHAHQLTDFVAILVAIAASETVGAVAGIEPTKSGAAGISLAVLWFVALRLRRTSEIRTVGCNAELGRVLVATFAAFGLLAVANGFVDVHGLRMYLIVGLPSGLLLLIASRLFWQRRLDAERAAGRGLPRALIVGARRDIEFVVEQIANASVPKYAVAGAVFSHDAATSEAMAPTQTLAANRINAVSEAIAIRNADVVILAGYPSDGGEFVRALSWQLENGPTELVLAWCLDSVDRSRIRFDTANGVPLMHVTTPTFSGGKHRVKRAMDVMLAGIALLVLAPMFGVVALLIRRDSAGPVFFRQERVGVDGTKFSMIKFRSMTQTAEAELAPLLQKNDGNGVLFKLRNDPRVTRTGALLRRYSLDELPQLWNILVGDMSIVGPRPPLACEVEQYSDQVQRRLFIKPGLTGPWQVGGRSDLSWDESVRLDLHYVENWSILGDLRIMWRTVGAVVTPVGAY